jgi:hypothetical protein
MTSGFITLIATIALTLSFIVALIFGVAQVPARRELLNLFVEDLIKINALIDNCNGKKLSFN